MDGARETLHATAISLGDRAALLRGPSGSGKSDLALRCLACAPNALISGSARLISDDQVIVTRRGGTLIASAPATLFGKMEVRGIGIVPVASHQDANVVMCVDLVVANLIERMPDPWPMTSILGISVPILQVDAWAHATPIKILLALSLSLLPQPQVCD